MEFDFISPSNSYISRQKQKKYFDYSKWLIVGGKKQCQIRLRVCDLKELQQICSLSTWKDLTAFHYYVTSKVFKLMINLKKILSHKNQPTCGHMESFKDDTLYSEFTFTFDISILRCHKRMMLSKDSCL